MTVWTANRETWGGLEFSIQVLYDQAVNLPYGNLRQFLTPSWTLWLVRRGGVTVHLETGGDVEARAGQWLLLPPFVTRSQRFVPETALLSIHFRVVWPGGRPLFHPGGPVLRPAAAWTALETVMRQLLDAVRASTPEALDAAAYARAEAARYRVLAALVECLRDAGLEEQAPQALDPRVQAVLNLLDGLGGVKTIPYPRLRQAGRLSRVQLDRLFVAQLGMTPRKYVDQRCLHRVCTRLLTSGDSIKGICFECGFRSTAHFTRWFRRQAGCTPREYRCNLREPGTP